MDFCAMRPHLPARFVVSTALVLGAGLLSATSAQAREIELANANFDEMVPDVLAYGFAPYVPGWDEHGVRGDYGELYQNELLDTGVFFNAAAYGYPAITNSSATTDPPGPEDSPFDQLAFIVVNTAANSGGPDNTALSQTVQGEVFELGQTYTFTLAVGLSATQPAGSNDPVNNPATIVMSIGYVDTISGDFVSLNDPLTMPIKASDLEDPNVLVADLDPTFDLLTDFSVFATDPLLAHPEAVGQSITVRVSQIGGDYNNFIADTARLTVVPEPTSLALLGLGGLLAARRRR